MDSFEALLTLFKSGIAPWFILAAWGLKEFFSFLLRWKAADSAVAKEYTPDDEWRKYCITKFDSIVNGVSELAATVKVLESQQQTIRLQVSRIENDMRQGGHYGRH